jgi:hypothetical protein
MRYRSFRSKRSEKQRTNPPIIRPVPKPEPKTEKIRDNYTLTIQELPPYEVPPLVVSPSEVSIKLQGAPILLSEVKITPEKKLKRPKQEK